MSEWDSVKSKYENGNKCFAPVPVLNFLNKPWSKLFGGQRNDEIQIVGCVSVQRGFVATNFAAFLTFMNDNVSFFGIRKGGNGF